MRDTLDLQELRERIDHYQTNARKRRNRAIILTLGMLIVGVWLWAQVRIAPAYIYTPVDGEWKQTEIEAPPKAFIPSDSGETLWMQTFSPYHLIEIGRDYWHEHKPTDVADCCFKFHDLAGTFGTFGIATDGADAGFYQNGRWSYWGEWLPTDTIIDLSLGTYTFVAVDANHDIYLEEGDDIWFKLNLPQSSETAPDTVAVGDEIFTVQDGIWFYVYEYTEWELLHPLADGVQYLGQDDTHLWLTDDDNLITYDYLSDTFETFALTEIGLSSELELVQVFNDGNETYLATRDAVIRIDDRSWTPSDVPPTAHGITTVGVLPNGTWMIGSSNLDMMLHGYTTVTTLNIIRQTILAGLILVPILILIAWLIPYVKAQATRLDRSKKLLTALFPDLPVYERLQFESYKLRDMPVTIFVAVIMLTVLTMVMWILEEEVGLVDNALIGTIFVSMFTILPMVLGRMIYIEYRKKNEETQQYYRRTFKLGCGAILIVGGFFLGILLLAQVILAPFVADMGIRWIVGALAMVAVMVVYFILFWKNPTFIAPEGYKEGNYETAIETLKNRGAIYGNTTSIYLGATYLLMGQYQDAYDAYLKNLIEAQNHSTYMLAYFLVDIATLLERIDNLDRAMLVYQAAIAIMPENPVVYMGLVNSYNNRREYPDRALEISNEMLSYMPDRPNRFMLNHTLESQIYGIHALALAQAGYTEKAGTYINKMYQHIEESYIPYYAGALRRHGLVKLLQGDTDGAIALLNRALDIDPTGDNANQIHKDLEHIATR